jgi:hypothetical protein
MHKRAARVAPKDGKWEAYFADAPQERCLGETPQDALAALREHAADCAKASVAHSKRCAESRRKLNVAIFASALLAVLLATAFIVQATANVDGGSHARKMYAHHRMHSHPNE